MKWKYLAAAATVFCLTLSAMLVHLGSLLAKPAPGGVGPPPQSPPLHAVFFPSDSGSQLQGWFARRERGRGAVILLHGIRANRTSMLSRARFLYDAGYSVLLFDLQAHGESAGERITFGYLEALDARAAVDFVRQILPGEPMGAIGSSLGGAACVLGDTPMGVDALILEAVYPDINKAVENRLRLRFGSAAAGLTPVFTLQLEPRLGISPEDLRPAVEIQNIQAPVFIIAGALDRRTTVADTRRLFEAAPQPKQLWIVPGARHVDFHQHAGAEYEQRVLRFLLVHLRQTR